MKKYLKKNCNGTNYIRIHRRNNEIPIGIHKVQNITRAMEDRPKEVVEV